MVGCNLHLNDIINRVNPNTSCKYLTMRWSKLQQGGEVPQPRSSHSITSLGDGFLAVWGGEHAPRVPLPTELYLYDLKTSTWKVACGAAGAPTERVAHAAAAINGTLYIHGGRTEVAEESTLGDLHAFDFATATWRQLAPSGPTPAARNYHAAITSGTSFYILGGCTKAGRVADLWRYDTVTGTWEEQPSSIAIKVNQNSRIDVLYLYLDHRARWPPLPDLNGYSVFKLWCRVEVVLGF